jgi:hypothetical protein
MSTRRIPLQTLRCPATDRDCLLGDLALVDMATRLAEIAAPKVSDLGPAGDRADRAIARHTAP